MFSEIMKSSIQELKGKHAGKPIIVLGAGEDLAKDIEALPYDINECITICANNKPLTIYPDPTYVFVIGKHLCEEVVASPMAKESIKISTLHDYSDYIVDNKAIWYSAPGAGALSTSLALYLGGDPIILCGFDLFRKNHCDGVDRDIAEKKLSLDFLVQKWSGIFKFHENAGNIWCMSASPLSKVFNRLI